MGVVMMSQDVRLSQLEPPVLEEDEEEWGLGEEGEATSPATPTEEEEGEEEGEGGEGGEEGGGEGEEEGSEKDVEFEQAFGSGEEDDEN